MDGELVAINLRTGLYYSSSGIGAVIWQLMEAGHTMEAIAAKIALHFNAPSDRVHADVMDFLQRLFDEDLVAVADAASRIPGDVSVNSSNGYQSPSLTSYNDMEQAFALDPPLRA